MQPDAYLEAEMEMCKKSRITEALEWSAFVHDLAGQAPYMGGRIAEDIHESADRFDVPRFVDR